MTERTHLPGKSTIVITAAPKSFNFIKGFSQSLHSQIGENCTSLTHLSLANCHLLKPADFQVFKIPDMSSNDSFYLQALAPLEHLVSLNLYRTSVSQTALLAILCNNRELEHLNLSACPNIQGDEVLYD